MNQKPFDRYKWEEPWTMIPRGALRKDGVQIVRGSVSYSIEFPEGDVKKVPPGLNWKDAIGYVDREFPMQQPQPAVGQVWAFPGGEYQIIAVFQQKNGTVVLIPTVNAEDGSLYSELTAFEWEGAPDSGVLAAGPGAPWTPLDWPWAEPDIREQVMEEALENLGVEVPGEE